MQTTYARTSNEATQLEEDGRRVARLAARESIVLLENSKDADVVMYYD